MLIPDMPNVPPQYVPVMIAQANQAQPNDVATMRATGVCYPVPSNYYSGENTLSPIVNAKAYFSIYEHKKVASSEATTVTVLQQPKHGILRLVTEADRGVLFSSSSGPANPDNPNYAYLPEKGYLGKDSASFLIEIGGVQVKVVYFFQAVEGPLGNTGREDYCSETGIRWKISSTIDANGNSTITSVEYQSPVVSAANTALTDTAALASTLCLNFTAGASFLGSATVDPSVITLTIADLTNGAVGQAVGNTITLDDNAAGHNWFIDTTPADNSEYLPKNRGRKNRGRTTVSISQR